jgi:hypothetical protein
MDSDLAPRGDSEKSSLPMSPILTAHTRKNFAGLDHQGLVAASARGHECNDRPSLDPLDLLALEEESLASRRPHRGRAVAGFEIAPARDIAPRAVAIGCFRRAWVFSRHPNQAANHGRPTRNHSGVRHAPDTIGAHRPCWKDVSGFAASKKSRVNSVF